MTTMFLISFGVLALVFLIMAVGVIFGRPAIRGSCGGLNGGQCACTEKCDRRLKAERS